jgi:Ran GTPase-activating protein (RanGAP) involved in mRNA processing and transport
MPKGPHDDDLSDGADSDAGDGPEIDHFDFGPVLQKLPNIEEFHVTFGVKDCGMNFEWNLFQFTARDCLLLAKCISGLKHLQVFHLHRSKVDDDKVRVLISHILDHPGIVELDLSHNLISDRGARAIGKFINNHSQLTKLNISDNHIRAAGAQAIAHALTKNTTLTDLNLRLNRLGDEGGQAICRAMLKNSILTDINLGSNDLTEPTAAILSQVVIQNSTLRIIDLSCNRLGPVRLYD